MDGEDPIESQGDLLWGLTDEIFTRCVIDKLLELAVRHLESVHPVVVEVDGEPEAKCVRPPSTLTIPSRCAGA